MLAQRSIARYQEIASASQIHFYEESGLLVFGVEDAFIKETREVATKMGTALVQLTPGDIKERYPWMGVPEATRVGLLQTTAAGHLSPRSLTAAQFELATKHGAAYLDATVDQVAKCTGDAHHFVVTVEGGRVIHADNVLVAAGCYTSLLPLLPETVVMSLTGAQAMLVEICADDAATLSGMPSMIYEGVDDEDCYYLLPPILYPDGKWLVKIGPSTAFSPPLATAADVDEWYRRGRLSDVFEKKALAKFKTLFPQVSVVSWRALLCVTDSTPKQNAYIDLLAPGWGICSGGNGWAAKSSDEIGCLAADMMRLPDHWGPDKALPRDWFRAMTQSALLPTPQLSNALVRVDACGNILIDKAAEVMETLTRVLVEAPNLRRRPAGLAQRLRTELANLWGSAPPSVLCGPQGCALAPAHPFVALHAAPVDVVVIP